MQEKNSKEVPKTLLFKFPKQYSIARSNFFCSRKPLDIDLESFARILIDMVIQKSFRGQIADMAFHRFLPGRVVFLYGTSTAGKSSILSYLKIRAKYKDLNLAVTGTDTVWALHIFALFIEYSFKKAVFLGSYLSIEEIFDCIWNPVLVSSLLENKSICERLGKKIRKILDEFRTKQNDLLKNLLPQMRPFFCSSSLIPPLHSGATVIVDTAADPGDIEEFFRVLACELVHCRMDIVLVYCSLSKLMERLYSRNLEAINSLSLNKGRPGAFPLEQYMALYEKTQLPIQAIDSITFSDTLVPNNLLAICKVLFGLISEKLKTPVDAYNENEWKEIQLLLQKSFGLSALGDKVHIKPKCSYQYTVNTGEQSIESCAENILTTLRI